MFYIFIFWAFIALAEQDSLESKELLGSKEEKPSAQIDIGSEGRNSRDFSEAEKIKVTGSRIKRIDVEGLSPIAIYTKEDLYKTGYTSLSEFFRNSVHSNFGNTLIHNRSTLTLINGKRTVYDHFINSVPLIAIERIEILKDGSSAIYGSDVVGGVINIITKKGFNESEFALKVSSPWVSYIPFQKGGSDLDASFAYSRKLGQRGNFFSSLQFQYLKALKYSERKQYRNPSFIRYSKYPNFIIGNKEVIADPRCPKDLIRNSFCEEDISGFRLISPSTFDLSNYSYFEYDLPRELTFYSHLIAVFNQANKVDDPIIDDLEVPENHKMSVGGGAKGKLQFRLEDHFWDQIDRHYFLETSVGLKGFISKTWDWDGSLKWSHLSHYKNYKDALVLKDFTSAIVSGVYDPFNPNKRDLSSVGLYDPLYKDKDNRFIVSLDFSGEIPWGGVELATGLQAYYNQYNNVSDSRVKAGEIYALAAAETGFLQRSVFATYLEAVKNFNNVLELQLAWRADYYSDFGLTDFGLRDFLNLKSDKFKFLDYLIGTPKLALRFQPINNFFLRASVGTSFDAPDLEQINAPTSSGYILINDTVFCYNGLKETGSFKEINKSLSQYDNKNEKEQDKIIKDFLIDQALVVENKDISENTKTVFKKLTSKISNQNYCSGRWVKGLNKGNKDLKPVKALTASLGGVIQLSDNHSFKFDYWYNLLKGRTKSSLQGNKTAVDAELRYGKAFVENVGVVYKRDENQSYNPIVEPENQVLNLATNKLSGIDLTWESRFPLNFMDSSLSFKNEFAYMLDGSIETFPGMGFVNNLGKYSLPRGRNFAELRWSNGSHDISFVLKTTAGTKKAVNQFETLKDTHIVDMFYEYSIDSKTNLKFGCYNVFHLKPVVDDSKSQGDKFDKRFYDLKGPSYFVELRKKL
ncbi:MAG: TonB-dependent receptor [Bdellovibrionales bacterium]|nr:TonB-dependent receptor [Bdellovibrionales bacterium]